MNNVIDTLIKRKSVRVFLDQEIEEENESPKWLTDALEKGKKFLDKK